MVGQVHQALAARFPGLLTIVAPRHPARGGEITALLPGRVRQRSDGEPPDGDCYVADTLGELGLFYRLAPVVFIGGSLVPHGGQNPLEPARLGCAVLHGPWMANFADALDLLGDALTPVADAAALTEAVAALLGDARRRESLGALAQARADGGAGALTAVLAALQPYLPPNPTDARA